MSNCPRLGSKIVIDLLPPDSNNSSRMTKDIDIHLLQNKLNGKLKGKGKVPRAPDLMIINNQIHQETNAANSCAASEGCRYEYSVLSDTFSWLSPDVDEGEG